MAQAESMVGDEVTVELKNCCEVDDVIGLDLSRPDRHERRGAAALLAASVLTGWFETEDGVAVNRLYYAHAHTTSERSIAEGNDSAWNTLYTISKYLEGERNIITAYT